VATRDVIGGISDNSSVKRVFGDPIDRDGISIIPVASLRGAFGGGDGAPSTADPSQLSGWGGGGAWTASPAGVYVVKNGETSWLPVVDVNRSILLGCLTGMVSLLVLRSIVRAIVKRG
jgi:uncharacterized spore protein YtfJ